MALDVAVRRPALAAPLRLAAVPARHALGGIVAASFVVRSLVALAHATPLYFPDEYIYSSLARSLAETGRPLIRGGAAHFPALLEPLLAAPFWLLGDPGLAYRLTQLENALAMSLAAVPVYLLARRIGLGKVFALACAALAVAAPDVFYVSFVLADPIAYPLVLTALYGAVCALDRPTRLNQIAFLGASGLATLARVQYVVLPFAFLVAAAVVERGRLHRAALRLRIVVVALALAAVAAVTLGPSHLLGYYGGAADKRIGLGALLHWVGVDGLLVAYSAGWVLVPGALVGLIYALARPRSRAETAFAAVAVSLAGALFLEAALYAANGSPRFQERYLMTLLPLVAPAFGLYVRRGLPARLAVAVAAVGLLALSARIPLSGFSAGRGKQDSPFLFAVFRLEQLLGSAVSGAVVVAVVAAVLSVLAAALAFRPRLLVPVALASTLAVFLAVGVGATAFDHRNASEIRNSFLPADTRWVDHAGLGRVDLVETLGAPRDRAVEQLFWNRSIGRFLRLDGAEPPDVFPTVAARTADDGRLLVGGRPLSRPFLLETYGVAIDLAGATRIADGATFELWRPAGIPRTRIMSVGHYHDDWLARAGRIVVYPDTSGRVTGRLRIALALPTGTRGTPVRFTADGLDRTVVVPPGRTRLLALDVDVRGPWTLRFRTDVNAYLGDGRAVSVQASRPTFTRGETTARAPRAYV